MGELTRSIFQPAGLFWDNRSRQFIKPRPYPEYLPVLAMLLAPHFLPDGDALVLKERPQLAAIWPWRSFTREQATVIEQLKEAGKSIREISRITGIGHMAIQRYFTKSLK